MTADPENDALAVEVDALLQRLDDAIVDVRDTVVTGALTGWKINYRRWGHADLCTTSEDGDGIGARLPITVPPAVTHTAQRRHPDRLRPGAHAVVHGRVEIGDRWNPSGSWPPASTSSTQNRLTPPVDVSSSTNSPPRGRSHGTNPCTCRRP